MLKHKIKVKKLTLFLGLLLLSANLFAQQRTISGTVTDSYGELVIGANGYCKRRYAGNCNKCRWKIHPECTNQFKSSYFQIYWKG